MFERFAVVKERYSLIGGIPRPVLGSNHNILDLIQKAIVLLELNDFCRISQFRVSEVYDDAICLIVQFNVYPTYTRFSLRMASQYISK